LWFFYKLIMTDMTPEELQAYRDSQYASTAPASWVWSEEDMAWLPPIPAPQDNQPYFWNEENQAWDPASGYPLADAPQGE
jgi:hypothetical protein